MVPPPPTSTDPHDCAVTPDRHLHPRHAHHRARFPSLTEFPDSPSVYSHAYPSPDTDALSDTTSSPLFDDEVASTIRSFSTEGVHDDSDIDDCTDDASHRISLQGPKIRFHSRAPWETDDFIPHSEESDNSPRSATFGSKLRGKAARADSLIRTFARSASRPSIDSARSRGSTTSFDISTGTYSSSRGALYDLAKQSMSTTSLSSSIGSSVRNQGSTRTSSYPEPSSYFHQAQGSSSRATVSLDGMAPPPIPLETVPIRSSSSDVPRIGRERSAKPFPVCLSQERHSSHDDFIHPYANPDLVVPSYTPSPEAIPSQYSVLGEICESDSNCTITDSTSIRSAAFASTEPSAPSRAFGNLRVNGKEISPPISVLHQNDGSFVGRNTRFLSLHPPPPGFDGPQRSNPTVTLITLQEAQARERYRTNTAVTQPKPPFPDADTIPEATEDYNEETSTAGVIVRSRTRPISAGETPTSHSQIAEVEELAVPTLTDTIPGRVLKHKKSGFMRLFGGRNSEAEREPALPRDGFAEQNSQTHGTAKPSKLARPRVGKPLSSPTLRSSNAGYSINDGSSAGDSLDGRGPPLRRRQAPSLSIVTRASDHSIPTSITGPSSPTGLNFTSPSQPSLAVPLSAPPGNTGFPGLQLRPISGSFSAHFADIVTSTVADSHRDVHTPSSAATSSTALSPFTPTSNRRSDDATAMDAIEEENLTIEGLQDQLSSIKKAWQQQIWELRGQIRDLNTELEDLRARDNQEYCEVCGRGERRSSPFDEQHPMKMSIVDRPRARTGDGARFVNGK